MASRRWTSEQRKQQSLKIHLWQPWLNSKGATTIEGKARSSRNAFKGGIKQQIKELHQLLREQKLALNEIV